MSSSVHDPDAARGGWSDARVERLKTLWSDGRLSAAAIAARLGVSRNAVLGKVHRLGLSNRRRRARACPPPPAVPPRPAPRRRPVRRRTPAFPSPAASLAEPLELPATCARLEALPPGACRWPVGDPKRPGFGFCGRAAGWPPYCETHRAWAYARPA